jgi:hypothetical protein
MSMRMIWRHNCLDMVVTLTPRLLQGGTKAIPCATASARVVYRPHTVTADSPHRL